MALLSMKMYLALLWGASVLFESTSVPVPETSSMNSTVEPNETTKQQISARADHNEPETQPATRHPAPRPAEVSAAATADTSVSPEVETLEAIAANTSDGTAGLVVVDTVAATTSSSGPRLLHSSEAAAEAAVSETAKPTEDQLHPRSSTTSADTTAPAEPSAATSTATSATAAVSLPQPTSTTKVTSGLSSTTSPAGSTRAPVFIQALSSPSASATTSRTVAHTSEAAPVFERTTSTTGSTTTAHITTSEFPEPAGLSSSAEPPATSTDSAVTTITTTTTAAAVSSSSPAGIWIPRVTKRLPIPTTKTTPATPKVSNSPASTEVTPCSNRSLVKRCLIIITCLAGLATVFMVSTIILCTKLSKRKYKVRKARQDTEMMCISALLPERNYSYTRQHNPVTNGVLVIHAGRDSDEDGGDNLTLSSFLPESDHVI